MNKFEKEILIGSGFRDEGLVFRVRPLGSIVKSTVYALATRTLPDEGCGLQV